MRVLKRVVRLAERGGVVVGAADPGRADVTFGLRRAAVVARRGDGPPGHQNGGSSLPEEEDALAPLYEREDEVVFRRPRAARSGSASRERLAGCAVRARAERRRRRDRAARIREPHGVPRVPAPVRTGRRCRAPAYVRRRRVPAGVRQARRRARRDVRAARRRAPRVRRVDQKKKNPNRTRPTRPNPSLLLSPRGAASAVSRARRRRRRDDAHSFAGEENAGRKRGGVDSKRKRDARDALDLARHRGGGRRVRFPERGARAEEEGSAARSKRERSTLAVFPPGSVRGAPTGAAIRVAQLGAATGACPRVQPKEDENASGGWRVLQASVASSHPKGSAEDDLRGPCSSSGGHQLAARVRGRDAGNAVGGGDEIRRRFRRGKRGKRRVREGKRNASGTSARVVFRAPLATARDVGIVPSRSRARRRANLRGVLVRALRGTSRRAPGRTRARTSRTWSPRRGGGCAAVGRRSVEAFFPRRRRSATTARRARRTGGPERETRTRTRWTRCFGTYRGG